MSSSGQGTRTKSADKDDSRIMNTKSRGKEEPSGTLFTPQYLNNGKNINTVLIPMPILIIMKLLRIQMQLLEMKKGRIRNNTNTSSIISCPLEYLFQGTTFVSFGIQYLNPFER